MATISEKLTHLAQTKALIKSAIGYRGMALASGTPFADYADAILNLGGSSLERGLVAHLPLHNNGSDRKSYYDATSPYPPAFVGLTSIYTGIEYLTCTNNPFYNGTTQLLNFGFSVWLKGSSLLSVSTTVPIAFGSVVGEIQIGDTTYNRIYIHGVDSHGYVDAVDAGITSSTTYYCLSVSVQAGVPSFYVNGKKIGLTYQSYSGISNTSFSIGRRVSGTNYFTGSITNLRIYNRSLSDDDASQLYAEGAFLSHSPIQPPSTEKLDLFYPLVGNGDDLSGNTWHLTEYNMTRATTTEFGYAQTLNGTTSYLLNSSYTTPDLSKGFTFSSWVYGGSITDSTSGHYPCIFSIGAGQFDIFFNAGTGEILIDCDGSRYTITRASAGLSDATTWYHLLFTKYEFSPGVWIPALYVNGVVKTLSFAFTYSAGSYNAVCIGQNGSNIDSAYYFSGKVRSTRFYLRGFEAEEAENLYLYEKHNRELSPTAGQIASYSFLSNGKDYFANKKDLTSYNGVTYTGEVANFSGSNYLYRNEAYLLATDAYLSVSFWVNPTSWQNGRVWYINDLNGYNYFYFSNTPTTGTWQLAVGRAGGSGVAITPSNNSLEWTHFVAVIETAVGGTIQLYKNGVLVGTATTPNYSPRVDSTRMFVGADTGGNYRFTGKVSMLKVYTSYLSRNDVEYLYETQRHKYLPEG